MPNPATTPTRYLEVTFRKGKAFAAYLYLDRREGDSSHKSVPSGAGLVLDYAADGRLIGVEITSPRTVTLDEINRVLAEAHQVAVTRDEIAPLPAA